MAGNEVDITVVVRGVDEAKRQIDELKRAVWGSRLGAAGAAGGGAAGAAGGGAWWTNPYALGAAAGAAPGLVPPIAAGLGLGVFAAFAAASGQLKKMMGDLTKFFDSTAARMAPTIAAALKPLKKFGKDVIVYLSPLVSAGGKILDAFIVPLDKLVRSPLFSQFVGEMAKVGVAFAKLFGPELAKILGAILQMFVQLAPAGMALWRALGPLVTTLVVQFAGLLGKLLPPVARALASLLSAITPLIKPLATILIDNLVPWSKLLAEIAPLVARLAEVLSKQFLNALLPLAKASANLVNALLPLIPPLVKLLNAILPPLIQLLSKPMIAALVAVTNVITKVLGGAITWFVNTAVPWLKNATDKVTGFFQNLGPNLRNFGKRAFTDLWDAIKSVAGNILSWASGWVSHLLNIFSPLKSIWNFVTGHGGSTAGGSPSSSSAQSNKALAQRLFPWSQSQFPAFNNIEMAEAGYSMTARNPSGAYGMAQFIGGPSEYYQYGGNPNTATGQLTGMFNYIRQRYGNPGAAWAFHLQHGWYDRGGFLPPGLSLAYNGTGRPEPVGAMTGGRVVVEIRAAGADDAFLRWLRQAIRVRGGNVQQVLGH